MQEAILHQRLNRVELECSSQRGGLSLVPNDNEEKLLLPVHNHAGHCVWETPEQAGVRKSAGLPEAPAQSGLRPMVFYTIIEGGQNPNSVRVINAMEWIISTQLEEEPHLRGILCSKLHSESQLHSIPPNSVAIFDGYVNRRFSFLVPSLSKGAPAWSKGSAWAVVVGPQAGEKGNRIRSCALNAVANFTRHFEDRLAAGHHPWGEHRTTPRHRGGRQYRLKKQIREAGGPGGWPSL